MEDREIHPVILLLAARKKSHPHEFTIRMESGWNAMQETGRWSNELNTLGWFMTDEEKALIYDNRRELVFDKIMERVMSRLLRETPDE